MEVLELSVTTLELSKKYHPNPNLSRIEA